MLVPHRRALCEDGYTRDLPVPPSGIRDSARALISCGKRACPVADCASQEVYADVALSPLKLQLWILTTSTSDVQLDSRRSFFCKASDMSQPRLTVETWIPAISGILLGVCGLVILCTVLLSQSHQPDRARSDLLGRADEQRRTHLSRISLRADPHWNGTYVFISLHIQNMNPVGVKNVQIACKILSETGTVLDTRRIVIHESLKANQQKQLGQFALRLVDPKAAHTV